MKIDDLSPWQHHHVFDQSNPMAERGTRAVMWITAVAMVFEIVAGWWFNSMALLADGWHMSSHTVAIGVSAFAYAAARRYARDPRFAFGTWKIEVLGGFASAIFLLGWPSSWWWLQWNGCFRRNLFSIRRPSPWRCWGWSSMWCAR